LVTRQEVIAAIGLAGLVALGCGDNPPGGATDGAAPGDVADGAAPGNLAYDIEVDVTTLTRNPAEGGDWGAFPKKFTTTFVWNRATGQGLVGPDLVTPDGRRYTSISTLILTAPFSTACDGQATLTLEGVDFTIGDDEAAHGSAHGRVSYNTGDTSLQLQADVTIVGAPDATAPSFAAPDGGVDPLARLDFLASELLPAGGTAKLVGTSSGDVVPLSDIDIDLGEVVRGVSDFTTALRYDETYQLVTDGFTDFAGHAAMGSLTIKTVGSPPLVPEDGFESVTGTMFGGAGVLRGGPLTPIAGQTSLLLNTGFGGGFGFLPYDLGSSLAVRLALAPGDSVVRFEGQLIAPDPIDSAAFVGAIRFGSVGHSVGDAKDVFGEDFAKVTLAQDGDVFVSPVKTYEYPLPADASGEIAFEIVGVTYACGLPPSPTVLVIDNLRVE
jgi:hypothetical protein